MERARALFRHINLRRRDYFENLMEATSLNLMELEILTFIQECPDSNTFTEILNCKGCSKAHLSATISHLMQEGYLTKQTHPNNKKVQYLTLLDKSKPVIQAFDQCVSQFRKDAFADIPQAEVDCFLLTLAKISTNLN